MAKNQNIPLKAIGDLANEVRWASYDQRDLLAPLCRLKPNRETGKLVVDEIYDEGHWRTKGVVYALVVKGLIFKIGQSINTFKSRVGSYNSGRTEYRISGKNSGANYWCLQSLLNIGLDIEVYAFYPDHMEWKGIGESGSEAFPSAKTIEKILIKRFENSYKRKPIGCTQG